MGAVSLSAASSEQVKQINASQRASIVRKFISLMKLKHIAPVEAWYYEEKHKHYLVVDHPTTGVHYYKEVLP